VGQFDNLKFKGNKMQKIKKVYLIGIGGIGMSGVAGLLKEWGYTVAGSEKSPVYPPASEILKKSKIQIFNINETGIEKFDPEAVIVGNAIKKEHSEVKKAKIIGIPLYSFPDFLEKFLLKDKKVLVCAGTHGKSTTSAFLGFALEKLAEDPSYLIGAVQKHSGLNYRKGNGKWFVIEGDEYPSSFFDKKAKFLHYKPYALILTSIERDHVDAYPEYESLKKVFFDLLSLLPEDGILIFNEDEKEVKNLVKDFLKRKKIKKIFSYGKENDADFRLIKSETIFDSEKGFINKVKIKLLNFSEEELILRIPGEYNALNGLAVLGVLYALGMDIKKALKVMEKFRGVKRRQEVLYSKGPVVIDDFAHHPTAVKLTLRELIKAVKPERTVVVFEPRTNSSKRKVFQKDYQEVLKLADVIFIKIPPGFEKVPAEERLDVSLLIESLKSAGREADILNVESLKRYFQDRGSLIVFMSSASFEKGLINSLLKMVL